jgi:Zn-dependent peptidase ImmA (M78 family)/plasmid maintenance system antidote protein VapI
VKQSLGQKFKKFRKELNVAQIEVAKVLGLKQTAISKIENGNRELTFEEFLKLKSVYGKSILNYFENIKVVNKTQLNLLRRTKKITQSELEIINKFKEIIKKYYDLEQLLSIQPNLKYSIKGIYGLTGNIENRVIEQAAKNERLRLNLGTVPIKDLFGLLEGLGIKIIKMKFPTNSQTSGVAYYNEEYGYSILININQPVERLYFTLAHEYFHILMEHITDEIIIIDNETEFDRRADYFAENFLMPKESIENFIENNFINIKNITPVYVLHISNYFGVSYKAALKRLLHLKYISSMDYEKIKKIQNINKLKEEIGMKWEFFASDVVYSERLRILVVQAVKENKLKIEDAANIINIPISKLRKQIIVCNS